VSTPASGAVPYPCPSHQYAAGTEPPTEPPRATAASSTQYAGRIRAARRSAYRPTGRVRG
jgi:hypothetical protein